MNSLAPVPLSARVDAPETVPAPQPVAGLSWHPITPADARAIHELRLAVGRVDHPRYIVSLQEIEESLRSGDEGSSSNTMMGVDSEGQAIAYGRVDLLPGQHTIVRADFEGHVHPRHRGEGIEQALVTWMEARGLQQLAASSSELPGWLMTSISEDAQTMRDELERHGFEAKREWFELRRNLTEAIEDVPLSPDVRLVEYGPEWAERTRLARNAAFRDHWASQPTTAEEWAAHDRLDGACAELSYLAVAPDQHGDDQVVAFLLTDVNEDEWEQIGFRFGYINYVGVDRDWRGRRLAQALVTHALLQFRERSFDQAVLVVDADSPTGAFELYRRLGFVEGPRSLSLLKEF